MKNNIKKIFNEIRNYALPLDSIILNWLWKLSKATWQQITSYRWIIIAFFAIAIVFFRSMLISFVVIFSGILGVFAIVIFVLWGGSALARLLFGCRICQASGVVKGHDRLLNIDFDNDYCYACHGKRIILTKKNDWYEIAMNAVREMKKHRLKADQIKDELGNYQSTIKISPSLEDPFIKKRYLTQEKSLTDALTLEEAHYELFQVIHQKAILVLHKQHLHLLQNRWEKRINLSSEHKFEAYSTAISASEDVEINTSFSDSSASLNHYLDSLGDVEGNMDLLQDIRKATERLKVDNCGLRD